MSKEERYLKKMKALSEHDLYKVKILYESFNTYEWDEEERDGEIVATVIVKSTGEKYDVLDYIKDETVVFDSTAVLMGETRTNLLKKSKDNE